MRFLRFVDLMTKKIKLGMIQNIPGATLILFFGLSLDSGAVIKPKNQTLKNTQSSSRSPASNLSCIDLFFDLSTAERPEPVDHKPNDNQLSRRGPPPHSNSGSSPPLNSYYTQTIMIDVPAGTFFQGYAKEIETTLDMPFKISATPFTQGSYVKFWQFNSRKIWGDPYFLSRPIGFSVPGDQIPLGENSQLSHSGEVPVRVQGTLSFETIVKRLTEFSSSDDPVDQEFMLDLFPDHVKGRIYDIATEAQLDRAAQLAVNARGQNVDQMVAEIEQLWEKKDLPTFYLAVENFKRYFNFGNFSVSVEGVTNRIPFTINGQPFFAAAGNTYVVAKDKVMPYAENSRYPPGGLNPLAQTGPQRVLKGAIAGSPINVFRSSQRGAISSRDPGFRIVAYPP